MEGRNRPADSDFKQQRLSAWKPIISDKFFYAVLLAIAIVFLAVGIPMIVESNKVTELSWDYTDCVDPSQTQSCARLLENNAFNYTNTAANISRCTCTIIANIKGFSKSKPFLFYAMDNYNQNHRQYVKSRWEPQLRSSTIAGGPECDPLLKKGSLYYAPCGLVANSFFNDTIQMFLYTNSAVGTPVTLSGKGISWASDRGAKFKNPTTGDLCSFPEWSDTKIIQPPNWPVRACEVGTELPGKYNPWSPKYKSSGLGYENEDFIVWMRLAGKLNCTIYACFLYGIVNSVHLLCLR